MNVNGGGDRGESIINPRCVHGLVRRGCLDCRIAGLEEEANTKDTQIGWLVQEAGEKDAEIVHLNAEVARLTVELTNRVESLNLEVAELMSQIENSGRPESWGGPF